MPGRLAMRVLTPLATCVAIGAVHAQTENPQVRLGRSVFYSQQVGAGPLFNAASCNECHHDGAGGRGPASDGVVPASLEIQLAATAGDGQRGGDPVYGHVFNTAALPGMPPEGTVTVRVIAALVAFERALPVPSATGDDPLGAELFAEIGCASCHRPQLPVELTQPDGSTRQDSISPYTDLRLHDLGPEMSDTTASGEKVPSKWRTAPLWGLGFRLGAKAHPTLLHDGRARSAEEAILWHSGEAAPARRNFVSLGPRSRAALLHWVETR